MLIWNPVYIGKDEEGKDGDKEKAAKEGKLIEKEESRVGTVAFKVYKLYWKSFGDFIAAFTILAVVFRQVGFVQFS